MDTGKQVNFVVDTGIGALFVAPDRFEHFEEPSARAKKTLAYDTHGRCCYYQHTYTLTCDVLDDNDNFYEEASYHETLTEWLLDNGLWLRRTVSYEVARGYCQSQIHLPRYELTANRPN